MGQRAVGTSRPFEVRGGTADGVMFTASYLERDGGAAGFCVAAHASDEEGQRVAQDVVNTWSAVWRTRRAVVAPTDPLCRDDARQPCRHVMMARAEMRVFARRGDQLVVIGQRGHAALTALLDDSVAEVVVIDPGDDIGHLRLDPDRLTYVVQPGVLIEDAALVVAALRAHYPRVRGSDPNGLCYATSDHAATISAVAASCDATFVLGEAGHPDILRPLRFAGAEQTQVHVVDDTARIRPAWLAGAASIGIVPTPSAHPGLAYELLDLLSGLGPLSVARRRLTTEVLTAWRGHHAFEAIPHGIGRPAR
jgi:4-hydroxy-3-methylbut-2-enyl diphosphate reductase